MWNYFMGPFVLWEIRMVRDIYHWRLQTTLAVIAGYDLIHPGDGSQHGADYIIDYQQHHSG